MNYKAKLESGEELLLQNTGEQTRIELKSDHADSHESQGSGFSTGKWSGVPKLFKVDEGAVLQLETEQGTEFFALGSNAVKKLESAPDLEKSKPVDLQETDEKPSEVSIKPMEPMKPMKAMEPLKPMD